MNRGIWMALLAGDLLLIGSSAYFLWNRIQRDLNSVQTEMSPAASPSAQKFTTPSPAISSSSPTPVIPATPVPPPPPASVGHNPSRSEAPESSRNILFHYRDSIPSKVEIVGDFNHWKPQPMRKDSRNNWTIRLALKPGVYSYNFVVDGKMIRDPSNRKTKKAGQKILSSLLSVKPGRAARKGAHIKPVSQTYQ